MDARGTESQPPEHSAVLEAEVRSALFGLLSMIATEVSRCLAPLHGQERDPPPRQSRPPEATSVRVRKRSRSTASDGRD